MNFNPKNKVSKAFLLITSFVIVSLILWNTNSFFKTFKEEERHKMEIWATAQQELLQSSETAELGNLTLKVFQTNTSTPMILVLKNGSIYCYSLRLFIFSLRPIRPQNRISFGRAWLRKRPIK